MLVNIRLPYSRLLSYVSANIAFKLFWVLVIEETKEEERITTKNIPHALFRAHLTS